MAGFHAETLRLLRRDLAATASRHKRDLTGRAKFPANSRALMAQKLDSRIRASVDVMRDLERLIAFAEGVNEAHEAVMERVELLQMVEPCEPADLGPGYKGGSLRPDELNEPVERAQ